MIGKVEVVTQFMLGKGKIVTNLCWIKWLLSLC